MKPTPFYSEGFERNALRPPPPQENPPSLDLSPLKIDFHLAPSDSLLRYAELSALAANDRLTGELTAVTREGNDCPGAGRRPSHESERDAQ
jgi:hypothetical protein